MTNRIKIAIGSALLITLCITAWMVVYGVVAQPEFAGLDQIVVGPLPRNHAGAGELPVQFSFDSQSANSLTIAFK
jgi:hypothetical protein